MKHSELKKQFVTSLRGVSDGKHSIHTLFSDWLEIAAIALHQLPYQSGDLDKDSTFESFEKSYLERIKPYSREELSSRNCCTSPCSPTISGMATFWVKLPQRQSC
ncbi:MAG: hypothetical protein AAF810_02360 [Cyanobacteria bacterium P01_D01_bin.36]